MNKIGVLGWSLIGLSTLSGCSYFGGGDKVAYDPDCVAAHQSQIEPLTPSAAELAWVGQQIYRNECSGRYENLVVWNDGEDFPSLGIGHFIWYPPGHESPFKETFPSLIRYMQSQGANVPDWLAAMQDAPWRSRTEFDAGWDQPLMEALRRFLQNTMELQTRFIAERLNQSLPRLLCATSPGWQPHVKQRFYAVAYSPYGLYALLDYVNFKGEGVSLNERYQGHGWGLLQVLQEMQPVTSLGPATVAEFSAAADRALTRRVQNAPPERNEARWLPGWRNRLATYRAGGG